MRDVTIHELMQSIELPTGQLHQLRVLFPKLHVRLPIDPRSAESWDDRFILVMERAGRKTKLVRSVRDDHVEGDAFVDLIYSGLYPDARYTLTIDPGAGREPYHLFEDCPHAELFAE